MIFHSGLNYRVVLRAKNDWVQRHASEQRAQKTMHHPSSRNCRATYSMPVSSRKMGRGQKAGGTGKRGAFGKNDAFRRGMVPAWVAWREADHDAGKK